MSTRPRQRPGATTAAAVMTNVIATEPDVQLARRLAEMQMSKSMWFGTTRGASGEKSSDILEKRTP